MCVLYRSGKEEWPWPISRVKINNQSIINQSINGHERGRSGYGAMGFDDIFLATSNLFTRFTKEI